MEDHPIKKAKIEIPLEEAIFMACKANNIEELTPLLWKKKIACTPTARLLVAIYYKAVDVVEFLLREADLKTELVFTRELDDNVYPIDKETNTWELSPFLSRCFSSLSLACDRGNLEIVKLLVENGTDVDRGLISGTPLMIASYNGHIEIVRYLLDKGSDVHAKSENGKTCMTHAIEQQHINVIRLLYDRKYLFPDNNTDFNTACSVGNCDIAELILGKGGGYVTAKSLALAISHGSIALIRYILMSWVGDVSRDGLLNVERQKGIPLLFHAILSDSLEMVKLLVECGANLHILDKKMNNCLDTAATCNNVEILTYLVAIGAAKHPDVYREAFHTAINSQKIENVKFFVENTLVTLCNDDLYEACSAKSVEIVEYLLQLGLDVNTTFSSKDTCLTLAARQGNIAVLDFLIGKGAILNVTRESSWNCITHALAWSHMKAGHFLFEKGGDILFETIELIAKNQDVFLLNNVPLCHIPKYLSTFTTEDEEDPYYKPSRSLAPDHFERERVVYREIGKTNIEKAITLLTGRGLCPDSPFYKHRFPRDLLRVIFDMCGLLFLPRDFARNFYNYKIHGE
jgi:ankyrin repeat protein